jgi:uncharacterized protein YndB with AHSA1/START domain
MMRRETGRTQIDRPRDEVWRLIATPSRMTDWYDGWDLCEYRPDESLLRAGTTFLLHSPQTDRHPVRCRVVAVVEPALVRWIEHHRLGLSVLVEFRLEVMASERTAVFHTKTTISEADTVLS